MVAVCYFKDMQKPIEICELIPDEHEPWFKPLVICEVGGVMLATKIAQFLQEDLLGEIWLLQDDDNHNPCAVSLAELLEHGGRLNNLKEYYEDVPTLENCYVFHSETIDESLKKLDMKYGVGMVVDTLVETGDTIVFPYGSSAEKEVTLFELADLLGNIRK